MPIYLRVHNSRQPLVDAKSESKYSSTAGEQPSCACRILNTTQSRLVDSALQNHCLQTQIMSFLLDQCSCSFCMACQFPISPCSAWCKGFAKLVLLKAVIMQRFAHPSCNLRPPSVCVLCLLDAYILSLQNPFLAAFCKLHK